MMTLWKWATEKDAVVEHEVDRRNRQQNTRHAANDKSDDKAERKQDWRPEYESTTKHGEQPVEDFDAGRHANDHRHDAEDRIDVGAGPHGEEVMQPNHEG